MTAAEPRELRCAASLSIPTPELYPSVTHTSLLQCFDVATRSLRNDGDSDPAGIVTMVRWTQRDLHASRGQVFANRHLLRRTAGSGR
jgi:hypothetical protein